jgi:ferrous iron transport protein B
MKAASPNGRSYLIALAGQPNVGKSTVFNVLTGLHQHLGNWPGKTVERREGTRDFEGAELRIVDLPGTYGFTANSPEERIARDFVLYEGPDVVVMIADAAALERNLYLLAELLVLPKPVVLGLNMMDVARSHGIEIDAQRLAAALGIPVVPMVARRAQGVAELVRAALRLAKAPETFQPVRPALDPRQREPLAEILAQLDERVPAPYPPKWVAMKLLEGDPELIDRTQRWVGAPAWQRIATLLAAHESAVLDIAAGRYQWILRMIDRAVARPRLGPVSLTDRLDRYALHPVWGFLLLIAVLALVFALTFQVAAPAQAWLEVDVLQPLRASLGAALGAAPAWVGALLTEGVLGGAGILITFLPVLVVFFAALGLLEDTGYLARAAYVMDPYMHRLGLHGKSFLPLFLGFGCNVPAVLGTRVIESGSGRRLTVLLAPLVPCSARLLVLAFLTPIFFGAAAFPVAAAFVGGNLALLALTGSVLSRTLFRGEHAFFIMEIPLYHAPNVRTIAQSLWDNAWAFLRKAGSVILLFSMALWALASFPGPGLEASYLKEVGEALSPLGQLLGLDWRLLLALLASFVAKENVIAALGILYGAGSEPVALGEALSNAVPTASALAFLAATMLFIPCVATLAVMRKELGSWSWTLFALLLHLLIAAGTASLIYHGCRLFCG